MVVANKLEQFLNHESGFKTSSKYAVASTGSMLLQLQNLGYNVSAFSAGRTKDAAKFGFQKHIVRLRSEGMQALSVGDVVPEICLVNSYDGTSSVQLFAGIFRLVCANGLMVGKTFGTDFRIKHVGNIESELQNAVEVITSETPQLSDKVKQLSSILPSTNVVEGLVTATAGLILPETAINVQLNDMLRIKRRNDNGSDLWSVYNRLQETAVRGGLRYQTLSETGQVRNHSTRAIKSVGRQVDVNRQLWDLVQEAV